MRKNVLLIVLMAIIFSATNSVFAQITGTYLIAKVNGAPATDSSAVSVFFESGGSVGWNTTWDATVLLSTDANFCNIYAYIGGTPAHSDLSIYTLPLFTASRFVTLGFNVNANGNFTITAEDSNFANNTQIWLIDSTQKPPVHTNLMTKNAKYTFSFTTSENVPGTGTPDGNSRFYLHFIYPSSSTAIIIPETPAGGSLLLEPNPVNQTTIIKYHLQDNNNVLLKVYNIAGKEVATLVNEKKEQGEYELKYNADNLTNGIYYLSLTIGGNHITKKLVVIK